MSKCPNCMQVINNNYCGACGEQKYNQKTIKGYVGQAFESLTDLDGRFLSSVKDLIFKPGLLTLDYLSGKHKYRINPIQLFLFANLIYFLFIAVFNFNTFTTPLSVHMEATNFWHQEIANEMVKQRLAVTGEEFNSFETKFNERVTIQSKTLIFLMIPALWLVGIILLFNKTNRALSSLVFSTHFLSFFLIGKASFLALLYILVYSLEMMGWPKAGILLSDSIMSPTIFLIIISYSFFAFKRVAKDKWWLAFLKAVLFGIASYQVVLLYRMVLFFTTYYSL